jgi:1,2-phenylacetyl-CoA epoxidase catalytic subunit
VVGSSPETEPETRTEFTNVGFLNQAFESWTDFVAANFLFDTALTVLLDSARDSTFRDLASRARRMLEEEPLHWLHGEGWTRRLAGRGEGVRGALIDSLNSVAPDTLAWFDVAADDLTEAGVLNASADESTRRFKQQINEALAASSLPTI